MSKLPSVMYRVNISEETIRDPLGAVVDGLTVIHNNGGMPAVEKVLEILMDVVFDENGDTS